MAHSDWTTGTQWKFYSRWKAFHWNFSCRFANFFVL
jgi:hypothetical protein